MLASRSDVNLWRVPLMLTLSAIGLFVLTMIPDTLASQGIIRLPWWFTMGGIDDGRAILGAMLGSVSTVLALIFSVALLVLSMVATLFGPRLLYRFLQDWVTQFTIGLFLGTFVYLCLVFLVMHSDAESSFIPQVSLITSWVLVLLSFAFLVYYSHRIAVSIQNPDLVAKIANDFQKAFLKHHRPPLTKRPGPGQSAEAMALQISTGARVVSRQSGYLQEFECQAMITAAASSNAVIYAQVRPGQFILQGEALAVIWPASAAASLEAVVSRHTKLGSHRILEQDSEFGIAQMVEIAIRALSPAINDTFTGVACVDFIGDGLLMFGSVPDADGYCYSPEGELRFYLPPLKFARLVKMAFDQIRQAAADNPAVLIRMLSIIGRLSARMSEAAHQEALMNQAHAILESSRLGALCRRDLDDVAAAWEQATSRTQPSERRSS